MDDLWWREADADYIHRLSERYPDAVNIEPAWTAEAATDPRRIERDPDPKSRTGAVRIVGYSPGAGLVITVIPTGGAHAGVNRLEEQRRGSARLRGAGQAMSYEKGHDDSTRGDEGTLAAAEVAAVREEYAEEEAEAAEIEAAENAGALNVAFSLRLTKDLDAELRARAAAERVSPSALVRGLLRDALHGGTAPVLTVEQVEQIVRRVLGESAP